MRRARHDLQPRLGPHGPLRGAIHLDDRRVVGAHDQQRRRAHLAQQGGRRQIGPPATRDHRAHDLGALGGGDQRSGRAGAGTEAADRRGLGTKFGAQPVQPGGHTVAEEVDVEAQPAALQVFALLLDGQEVEQQRAEPNRVEPLGDQPVARTVPA